MTALALLQPASLLVYYPDRDAPAGGEVPPDAVRDMEVQNLEALEEWVLRQVPKDPKGPAQTVIVVGETLCYTLELNGKDEEETMKYLLRLTPFTNPATTVLTLQNKRYAIATNQDLYEGFVRSLSKSDHAVSLVVPYAALTAVGIQTGEGIGRQTARRVSDALSQLKGSAFSVRMKFPEPGKDTKPTGNNKNGKKKLPVGWIIFVTVAVLYAVGMLVFLMRG